MSEQVVARYDAYVPFVESNPDANAEELREIMDEQGYLFFRRLLPIDTVLTVRHDVLEVLKEANWLDPEHDLMKGKALPSIEPRTEGQAEYTAVYRKVLKLPSFHDFPAHPALMTIAQKLLDDEVFVHPRRIGRITFPGSEDFTTPPHQDYFYIRGAVETYSCWTPLGDCPRELGGLAVWPGSHRLGFIEHNVSHLGAIGGQGVPVDEAQVQWHTVDYEVGDALFFRAYTIHKALPNLTKDRLRLSTDNRYQKRMDEIDPGALKPHFAGR
jgi:ectoine hydroxylase-related dioxygenase (phytanoyl-CoA dioxygenase family)